MLTVILDTQLTRRKRSHLVVKPDGETQFAASRFSDVLEWLYEREIRAFNVEDEGGHSFHIHVQPTKTVLLGFGKATESA